MTVTVTLHGRMKLVLATAPSVSRTSSFHPSNPPLLCVSCSILTKLTFGNDTAPLQHWLKLLVIKMIAFSVCLICEHRLVCLVGCYGGASCGRGGELLHQNVFEGQKGRSFRAEREWTLLPFASGMFHIVDRRQLPITALVIDSNNAFPMRLMFIGCKSMHE